MTERPPQRRPMTFKLDDPGVIVAEPDAEARAPRGGVRITPEADPSSFPVVIEPALPPAPKRFKWGALFWGALGGLVSLGIGLSIAQLIEQLFARSESLGYLGAALAALVVLSLIVVLAREAMGLARLAAIENLHRRAAAVFASDDRTESRTIMRELLAIAHQNPHLARARAALTTHAGEIIDGADLIRLTERELMTPLDEEARRIVSRAAQRVSVVTAVSPRALIDVLFVAAASLRMVRQLALLYGGRPGALGLIKLLRHTLANLAITGGLAATDSLVQQMLGHGIAAKLSSRLGEGVLNGLLTARLGLAAIDATRPMPFAALPRPVLSDLARDLLRKRDAEEM